MGFFYFDESIQDRLGFIVGAFVYSAVDVTPEVFAAIGAVGLRPGIDEYKSGAVMRAHPERVALRSRLVEMLSPRSGGSARLGIVVAPSSQRTSFGDAALDGLQKILRANELDHASHVVYLDEGIRSSNSRLQETTDLCDIRSDQDSRSIGGIQLADLAAHYAGTMLAGDLAPPKQIMADVRWGYGAIEMELRFEPVGASALRIFQGMRTSCPR